MCGSIAGEAGASGNTPYAASKSALNGLALPMARDLGFLGIRAMTIAVGPVNTPIMEKYRIGLDIDEETWAQIVKNIGDSFPLGTMGEVDNFSHWV